MTTPDLGAIIAGLTEAQRATLEKLDGHEFRDWQASREGWPQIRPAGRIKIRSLGLVEESWLTSWHVRLTPLGLAVRAHLQENPR
jgi:hypothetical protein